MERARPGKDGPGKKKEKKRKITKKRHARAWPRPMAVSKSADSGLGGDKSLLSGLPPPPLSEGTYTTLPSSAAKAAAAAPEPAADADAVAVAEEAEAAEAEATRAGRSRSGSPSAEVGGRQGRWVGR